MARIPYVEKESAAPEQEKILTQVTQKSGKIANIWRLWSHSPGTLEAFLPFNKSLTKGSLDPKLRELAYLKTSMVNDCAYCANAHKTVGLRVGVTQEQIDQLGNPSSEVFSPVEQLVLRYAEELTRTVRTSNEIMDELKQVLSPSDIVELNLTIGTANLTNRFNMSLMTDPD